MNTQANYYLTNANQIWQKNMYTTPTTVKAALNPSALTAGDGDAIQCVSDRQESPPQICSAVFAKSAHMTDRQMLGSSTTIGHTCAT